jgi:putative acetyltransferase
VEINMSRNAVISPVHSEDFPRVVDVWEASVRATHEFVTEDDIQFFKPLVRDGLPHAAQLACVRDHGDEVVGFVAVTGAKVEMLFVAPVCIGQGIGRRLLTHAITSFGAQTLDVNEQNPQAVGFYRRMGFEVVGRSELDDFGKPHPLLHMCLGGSTSALHLSEPTVQDQEGSDKRPRP